MLFELFRILFLLEENLILGLDRFEFNLSGKLDVWGKLDESCVFNIKLATATL